MEKTSKALNIDTLKLIYLIIIGVALTLSIEPLTLNHVGDEIYTKSFKDYQFNDIAIFFIIFLIGIRFCHGNIRYLEKRYLSSVNKTPRVVLLFDFYMMVLQGILFCLVSVYQHNLIEFWFFVMGVFLFDIIWFSISLNTPGYDAPLKRWLLNNLWIIILLSYLSYYKNYNITIMFIAIIVNTIADYLLCFNHYFPEDE